MYLKVEFTAGTDIRDAAIEALSFARKNEVGVEFDFNGVQCMVCPHDTSDHIIKEYHYWLDRKYKQAQKRLDSGE